ncbi:MAG TPA: hypothetical protein VMV44_03470 [Rectinemataceae bacterium]|nr:hypothetical protein [Rectinemataceae bacterium]
MKGPRFAGSFRNGLPLIAFVALLLASCATKPPAAPSAEPPKASALAPQPPAETPWYSAERRLAPPLGPILVIGLPEPSVVRTAIAPDLGQAIRKAPMAKAPMAMATATTPMALGEPALPAKLQAGAASAPGTAAASQGADAAKAKADAEAKAKAEAEARAKAEAAAKAAAKKPAPHPAPAAPLVAASPQAPVQPAKVETIPSIPQSLVPIVDASVAPPPSPQRSFQVELGGMASIPFVGTGWTYLGERDGKDGVLYDSRRFEGAGALFTLLASKLGEYNLRFLRQDLQNGTTTEELVHLSVLPKGTLLPSASVQAQSQGTIATAGPGTAAGQAATMAPSAVVGTPASPSSPATVSPQSPAAAAAPVGATSQSSAAVAASSPATLPVPPNAQGGLLQSAQQASAQAAQVAQSAQALAGSYAGGGAASAPSGAPSSSPSGAVSPAPSGLAGQATSASGSSQIPPPAPGSPEAFLATARAEYAAGRAPTTIAAAQGYLALSPQGPSADEALWLEAQAYELNSSSRDVAKALGLYRQIVSAWPRSQFWSGANDRVAYIQRYYFDIR